jgi:hypothetical protein
MSAAGHGWFVDDTPYESSEYRLIDGTLSAEPNSDAYGKMDLLTTVMHEIGHVLGYEHGADELMQVTLAAGLREPKGGAQANPNEVTSEAFEVAVVDGENNMDERVSIDSEMENLQRFTSLDWNGGWTMPHVEANFSEFLYEGFEEELRVEYAQKKKRLAEASELTAFELQKKIDWRIEID